MKRLNNLVAVMFLIMTWSPLMVSAECQSEGTGNELFGTLLGAAIGGLVGSQIGSGDGTKVAIGAGVLAGGFLGNRVGRQMDCRDIEYHNDTAQSALETQASGYTSEWMNPDTGHSGTVTPVETYERADGVYCRNFEQTITVDGSTELANGTACRQIDGTWQIIDS